MRSLQTSINHTRNKALVVYVIIIIHSFLHFLPADNVWTTCGQHVRRCSSITVWAPWTESSLRRFLMNQIKIASKRQRCSAFIRHHIHSHITDSVCVRVCVFLSSQHPPKPQYNSPTLQRLQVIFSHFYLTIFGNVVALANVMCICVSSTHTNVYTHTQKQQSYGH